MVEANWIQQQSIAIQGEERAYILTPQDQLEKISSGHLNAWTRNVKVLIKASDVHLHNLIRRTDPRQYPINHGGAKSGAVCILLPV